MKKTAKRTLDLVGLTGGVSASYAAYLFQSVFLGADARDEKLRSTNAKAARRITERLGTLQGPLMKLGQTLSMSGDVLPEEIIAELTALQMRAPGMHASLVRAQIKSSLCSYPEDLYATFDTKPFAAASLGQVHHATTKAGEAVVVKVQYPDMERTVKSDFAMLRAVSLPAQLSKFLPPEHLEELEREITAETDYVREAANMALFREELAPLSYVSVPKVDASLSSDRVLTMSPMKGLHIDAFLAKKPSQKIRNALGANLMDLYYFQVLRAGAFHADPHPGNYLYGPAGEIALLDFGCIKKVPPEFMLSLRRIFLYPGDRASPAFTKLLDDRYALFGKNLTKKSRAALVRFAQNFYGKVYPPDVGDDDTPFNFSNADFLRDYMRESANLVMAKGSLPEYVFLARAEAGLYQTLHKIGAHVHTSRIVRKYI